jgi:hypothetical protein
MIDLVDTGAAPLRLPLGSDTYDDVRASLVARLAEHDAQRDVAFSVVRDELMLCRVADRTRAARLLRWHK